jgi:hypothetical protein
MKLHSLNGNLSVYIPAFRLYAHTQENCPSTLYIINWYWSNFATIQRNIRLSKKTTIYG